jgi:hypothetical protein
MNRRSRGPGRAALRVAAGLILDLIPSRPHLFPPPLVSSACVHAQRAVRATMTACRAAMQPPQDPRQALLSKVRVNSGVESVQTRIW